MPTGGRKTHLQVMHEISAQFTPNTPLSGLVGVLPAGAVLNAQRIMVTTAFNSTTNTLGFGTAPGLTDLIGAVDIKTVGRVEGNTGIAFCGPLAADRQVWWTLAFTGAAPTAGVVTFWQDYVPAIG